MIWLVNPNLCCKFSSKELFKFVLLKYPAPAVIGPKVERAKIPVPFCSFPFISRATVYGVVKPCLPILITVFGIAVNPKYAFDNSTPAFPSEPALLPPPPAV